VSPSRLLIPLSYGALLGGTLTLIGTPPNIIVNDILRDAGFQTFGFFSFTPMGLILLIAGIAYMLTIGRRILPDHKPDSHHLPVTTPLELLDIYRLPDNMYHLRVMRQSPLHGLTLAEANLRHAVDLSVLEIMRHHDPHTLLKLGTVLLQNDRTEIIQPAADTVIEANDILLVRGDEEHISRVLARWNLALLPQSPEAQGALINQEAGIAEVLVRPRSSFAGKTLAQIRFGTRFRLTVIAIRRPGTDEALDPSQAVLKAGDVLLVQGRWKDILRLKHDHRPDFVVLGQPEIEEMMGAPHRQRAPLALMILLGMILLMIFNLTAVSTASLLAALLMVLAGCLTMDDAYDAIDWKSIFLIAGMLPMATALESVGLVEDVAGLLTGALGDAGLLIVLGSLFLFTAIFTQVLSNTATTVLVAPIGLAVARELGVQPQAFLMAVAIAASMAFASPIASPTNTLIMEAGQYRFKDYGKAGVPLVVITMALSLIFLPLLFPF
jgi:di/tricarboxylate transporter